MCVYDPVCVYFRVCVCVCVWGSVSGASGEKEESQTDHLTTQPNTHMCVYIFYTHYNSIIVLRGQLKQKYTLYIDIHTFLAVNSCCKSKYRASHDMRGCDITDSGCVVICRRYDCTFLLAAWPV